MDFDISKLTGLLKTTAETIDQQYNKNGKIDNLECSIFSAQARTLMIEGKITNQEYNSVFGYYDANNIREQYYCPQDNTRVDIPQANVRGLIDSVGQTTEIDNVQPPTHVDTRHEETVKRIANSWAATYKISNDNNEFTEFVERLYEIAIELNLTETNSGNWDSNKYPTKQDQVIDEMLAAFANESKFDPAATSASGTYYGIFQMSKGAMDELRNKGCRLPSLTMDKYKKLSRIEQLEYMLEYTKICKKDYSKLGDQAISPKQVYAMWEYPRFGDPNKKIPLRNGRVLVGRTQQQARADTIAAKQSERDRHAGSLEL